MSSTIEQTPSKRYVNFDEYIDYQLQKTRDTVRTTDIITACLVLAIALVGWLLVFVLFDHWVIEGGFSQTSRVVMLAVILAGGLGWAAWKIAMPSLRRVNRLFAARLIERAQPGFKSTLLNLIDLRDSGRNVPEDVRTTLERRAAVSLSETDVDAAVDRRPLLRSVYVLCGLILLFMAYSLVSPKKVSSSVWRALFPTSAVAAPTETVITAVDPGKDIEVVPGTRLGVTADITGRKPERVVIRMTTADRALVNDEIEMRPDPEKPGRYAAEILGLRGEGIQQSLTYKIVAGDDRTDDFRVTVSQPPSASVTELLFSYPEYMGRESRTQSTAEIDDFEGTAVTFFVEANQPLRSAVVTFSDDAGTEFGAENLPLTATDKDRRRFRGQWTLRIADDGVYPTHYHIAVRNERDETDPAPVRHTIRIHPDQRPGVRIVSPREPELERPANAILPIAIAAEDDFRLTRLTLFKQKNDEEPVEHAELFKGSEPTLLSRYQWRLDESLQGTNWELAAGDRVTWWVQAEDNNEFRPQPGRSNTQRRVIVITDEVPEEEVQRQLAHDQRQNEEELRSEDDQPRTNEDQTENPPEPQPGGRLTDENEPKPQDAANEPQKEQGEEDAPMQPAGGQDQEGEGQQGEPQEPAATDGSDDGRALERLNDHYKEQNPPQDGQQPEGDPNNQNQPEGTDGGNNGNPGNKPPMGEKPNGEQPNGNQPKGNQQPDGEQPPDKTPPKNGTENGGSSELRQPGDGTKPNQPSQPNNPNDPNKPNKPQDQGDTPQQGDQPMDGDAPPEPGTPKPNKPTGSKPGESGSDKTEPGAGDPMPDSAGPKPDGTPPQTGEGASENMPPNPNGAKPEAGPNDQPGEKTGPNDQPKPPAGENGPMENGPMNDSADPNGEGAGGNDPSTEPTPGTQPKPGQNDQNQNNQNGKPENDPNAGETGTEKTGTEKTGPEKTVTDRKPSDQPGQTDKTDNTQPANGEPRPDGMPPEGDQPDGGQPGEQPERSDGPGTKTEQPQDRTEKPDGMKPEGDPNGEGRVEPAQEDIDPNGTRRGQPNDPRDGRQRTEQADDADPMAPKTNDPAGGADNQPMNGGASDPNGPERPDGNGNGEPKESAEGNEPAPGQAPGENDPRGQQERRPGSRPGEGTQDAAKPSENGKPADGRTGENANQPNGNGPQEQRPANGSNGQPAGGTAENGQPTGEEDQPGNQPGTRGAPGKPGTQDGRTDDSRQPPAGAADQAEAENLADGRKAADLVLKKLSDELRRGEVNEDWLKEMGWNEEDAADFLQRMKRDMQQSGDESSPESIARQRQFNEWVRQLGRHDPKTVKRSGSDVRQRAESNHLFEAAPPDAPPELRDISEAFERAISERNERRR